MEVGVRISKWESELWGYIGSGNAVQCPMYSYCQKRLAGGWCLSNNLNHVARLLDDRQFKASKYDFIEAWEGERIFQLVERLAQSVLKMGGVHCPPVPAELVSMIDKQRPIEIRIVLLKTNHGAIWCLKDGWVIQLNGNDTPARRTFTLFHEAFHILAHGRTTPVFKKRDCETGSFNELLADYFAACVLMPRKWVEEKWAVVEDLDRMAEIFAVEKSLMWVRLREMDLV